jgi:ABC-type multidrug transport system fused ATPase/permease subunit
MAVSGLAVLVVTMLFQNKPVESLVPTLGLFAAAAFRLMPSVSRFLGGLQTLRFNLPVIDTLYREREFLRENVTEVGQKPLAFEHTIEFRDVVFSYPGVNLPQIDRLSITIGKGAVVGFVGGSGAGKSTVVDLLLGLLQPSSGAVLVDGRDIHSNLRAWQCQIGYVPQTIYLTDDSIRRNVAFGVPASEISDDQVKGALSAAQLLEFVESLPKGLGTIVGERGVRLSGGQRQRIGIARALYHNPELLVLDEASSALDTQTEQEVMQAVLSLRGKKTVIIVAHRICRAPGADASPWCGSFRR